MRRGPAVIGLMLMVACAARAEVFRFDVPSDDRWHYPFNFNAGSRPTASCFGSTGDPNFTTFNDRDGIFVIAWRTDSMVPAGLPPASYDLKAVRVTLTHLGSSPASVPSWPVDLTPDEWFTMDYPIADADSGQPLELFGAGFGPVYSHSNWTEGSPYVGGDDIELTPRDPFPFVYEGATSTQIHVEDSVKDAFTPQPWAIGMPSGYVPGSQTAPFPVHFDVNLTLSGGGVLTYFREQLALGRVFVVVTSLQVTFMFAETGYPTFLTKEGAPLTPGGKAPRMELTLVPTGDVNGNSRRDLTDAGALERCMDGPDLLPLAPAPLSMDKCLFLFDFDEDGDVDLKDHGAFARRFP